MAGESAITREIQSTLSDWIRDAVGENVPSDELQLEVPTAGGWSNDTWFVRFSESSEIQLVVRLEPRRQAMFPDYDLSKQCQVMQALAGKDGVPVPTVLAADLRGERLGRPAFIMEYVSGRVPSDNPPTFVEDGWLYTATPDQQRQFHENLLTCMATVHQIDAMELGHKDLTTDDTAAPTTHELDSLQALWEYDRGPAYPAVIDRSLETLQANAPSADLPVGLVWGDARPANVICGHDSFDIIALLDWELAGIGVAESEIMWLQEMNWVRTEGAGHTPLPGFLSPSDSIAFYEAKIGRRLRHLDWFAQFASTRVAILMHRFLRTQVNAGMLDEHHRVLTSNSGSQRLERYGIPGQD